MLLPAFKKMSVMTLAIAIAAPMGAHAMEKEDNKLLRDAYNHPVRSIEHKTCVRTQWEAPNDVNYCAEKVAVAPSPARALMTEARTVTFNFDSASLTPDAQQKLDQLAQTLRASGDVRGADIVGFADQIGTPSYNLNLSKRRAQSVQNYLAQRGYMNTRVADTRGLGETYSVTSCQDQDKRSNLIQCLRPDRRVEVKVLFTEQLASNAHYPNIK